MKTFVWEARKFWDSTFATVLLVLLLLYFWQHLHFPLLSELSHGDSWGDWLRTGELGEVMLAAYAPEGATNALID